MRRQRPGLCYPSPASSRTLRVPARLEVSLSSCAGFSHPARACAYFVPAGAACGQKKPGCRPFSLADGNIECFDAGVAVTHAPRAQQAGVRAALSIAANYGLGVAGHGFELSRHARCEKNHVFIGSLAELLYQPRHADAALPDLG